MELFYKLIDAAGNIASVIALLISLVTLNRVTKIKNQFNVNSRNEQSMTNTKGGNQTIKTTK